MSLTVLLDLDNTLISNDMDSFVPAYLKSISSYLPQFSADKVIKDLLSGTQAMIVKNTPVRSLEQTFDEVFYQGLGVEKAAIIGQIDTFYREGYPKLKPLTALRSEARRLVEYVFEKNYSTVIATNPLFPRTAILQRLEWAALPIDQFPYNLVTSYENCHFSKPHSAYLAEILAQLGWPDQPAVMVGDNLRDEIIPAGSLGIPAFWVNESASPIPPGLHPLSAKGALSEVIPWLESLSHQTVEMHFSTPGAILATLKSTPAALDTLLSTKKASDWIQRPDENEWSLTEISCHLRDVDRDVNLPRMKRVASGENPFVPGIETDVWSVERDYIHQNGSEALTTFINGRTELVQLLEKLDEQSWKLPARHAIFGPTQLVELAGFIATHDRTHLHQTVETIRRNTTLKL
jgi:FMN phosphatase YigB (HAD superfamily)